jgi:hypothetical protein
MKICAPLLIGTGLADFTVVAESSALCTHMMMPGGE